MVTLRLGILSPMWVSTEITNFIHGRKQFTFIKLYTVLKVFKQNLK